MHTVTKKVVDAVRFSLEYLERIKQIAQKNNLKLLPEIHAEYGLHLHDEVAKEGYTIYDFSCRV
jgi:hypothetical protein